MGENVYQTTNCPYLWLESTHCLKIDSKVLKLMKKNRKGQKGENNDKIQEREFKEEVLREKDIFSACTSRNVLKVSVCATNNMFGSFGCI